MTREWLAVLSEDIIEMMVINVRAAIRYFFDSDIAIDHCHKNVWRME